MRFLTSAIAPQTLVIAIINPMDDILDPDDRRSNITDRISNPTGKVLETIDEIPKAIPVFLIGEMGFKRQHCRGQITINF